MSISYKTIWENLVGKERPSISQVKKILLEFGFWDVPDKKHYSISREDLEKFLTPRHKGGERDEKRAGDWNDMSIEELTDILSKFEHQFNGIERKINIIKKVIQEKKDAALEEEEEDALEEEDAANAKDTLFDMCVTWGLIKATENDVHKWTQKKFSPEQFADIPEELTKLLTANEPGEDGVTKYQVKLVSRQNVKATAPKDIVWKA